MTTPYRLPKKTRIPHRGDKVLTWGKVPGGCVLRKKRLRKKREKYLDRRLEIELRVREAMRDMMETYSKGGCIVDYFIN